LASNKASRINGILGTGIATGCILWVLYHLVLFYSTGYVMVGESNKGILLIEIAVTLGGFFCFIWDYLSRLR
jgi:hypothetical protein